jgi:hypothetical protein
VLPNRPFNTDARHEAALALEKAEDKQAVLGEFDERSVAMNKYTFQMHLSNGSTEQHIAYASSLPQARARVTHLVAGRIVVRVDLLSTQSV